MCTACTSATVCTDCIATHYLELDDCLECSLVDNFYCLECIVKTEC